MSERLRSMATTGARWLRAGSPPAPAGAAADRVGPDAEQRFVSHIHNLRGLSILLIVAVHCISIFDWAHRPEVKHWLDIALLNSTIFFLFIAGYLFQHLSRRFDYRSYLRGKLRNVIVPYLLVSIPAIFAFTFLLQRDDVRPGFYDAPVPMQIVEFYLTGQHLAPFWFLPTIALFYVTAPLWITLDRAKGFYWTLPLWLLLPVFVSRGLHAPLQSFIHFAPVYLLGMAFSRHRVTVDRLLDQGWWLLLPPVALLVAFEHSYAQGTHSWYNTLQKILLCPVLYQLLRQLGPRGNRYFARLGDLSFGIFFLHSYVITSIKLLLEHGFGIEPPGSVGLFLLAVALIVPATAALVAGLKRLLGRYSRIGIGC